MFGETASFESANVGQVIIHHFMDVPFICFYLLLHNNDFFFSLVGLGILENCFGSTPVVQSWHNAVQDVWKMYSKLYNLKYVFMIHLALQLR